MDSRRLNRRVVLQQLVAGQDEIGQPTQVWSTLATAWANVRYLSGVETIKADAVATSAKVSIRIRYRADVTAAMRVVLGATVFQILAVLPDEQAKERLDLACEVIA